ncbi:ATP-grasp domain-containing protein [Arenibaculum pallidiluteum]|uniref:ATP-grasp domain-containing protein n=1 Tax=Arenibaculum pallidiluteum TaxID=2812559 RepID=UPI001A960904|nr:ATP-grasp domain-containing protein [Arenibaculum pallidiluteum]
MPPGNSSVESGPGGVLPASMLVVALSARALAAAARRAGFAPVAIDLFGDLDTCALAVPAFRVEGDGAAFRRDALLRILDRPELRGLPLVYGAGFEHDPDLLAAMARGRPVIGNTPSTVSRLKDPFAFSEALARHGIPHPAVARRVADPAGWLSKSIGASGGAHVRPASAPAASSGRYLQARVGGRPLSALFVADGERARLLGFSAQWHAPTARAPFRYGGAFGPVRVPETLGAALAAAICAVTREFGLVGLNAADFLVDGPSFHLVEVNPRPGATLDVLDGGTLPLLGLHVIACRDGRIPDLPDATDARPQRAAAILYARRSLLAPDRLPAWTADWPAPGATIPAGAPVCTVMAKGRDARRLVRERLDRLRVQLGGPRGARPRPRGHSLAAQEFAQ